MSTKAPLLLIALLLATGCSKKEDDTPTPPADPGDPGPSITDPESITIDGPLTVRMTVDGEEFLLRAGDAVIPLMGTYPDGGEPATMAFSCGLYNGVIDLTVFEMRIGSLSYTGDGPTMPDFLDFFSPGEREYGYAFGGADGVNLEWFDANYDPWRTQCGSGDQEGSVFTITDVVEEAGLVKVRATFEAKLYRCLGEDPPKVVTDGLLVLTFQNG